MSWCDEPAQEEEDDVTQEPEQVHGELTMGVRAESPLLLLM